MFLLLFVLSTPAVADENVFKANGCNKCHKIRVGEKGPSVATLATRLRDDATYRETMKRQMCTPRAKGEHPNVTPNDPVTINSVIDWISSK